jgi:hypothetical protein
MVRRSPLNPISTTAYWTLIARIQDAEAASPLCGDYLAKLFSSPESEQARAKFGQLESAAANIVARHRIIDDYLTVGDPYRDKICAERRRGRTLKLGKSRCKDAMILTSTTATLDWRVIS